MLDINGLPIHTLTGNGFMSRSGVWNYAGSANATFTLRFRPGHTATVDHHDPSVFIVNNKSTSGALTVTPQGAGTVWDGASVTSIILRPGESRIFFWDGNHWVGIGATKYAEYMNSATSAAETLTLDRTGPHRTFTGTTTTWTLPAISASNGLRYVIKNKGSGAITLTSSTNGLYAAAATTTVTIAAGAACEVICDGTHWNVIYNG